MGDAAQSEAVYSQDGTVLLSAQVQGAILEVKNGCKVIARKALMYQECLERVVLPDSLEAIEPFAFACTRLARFEAPPRLRTIGEKAFFQCRELRSATLNEGLTHIGEGAFSSTSIDGLRVPASVEEIGRGLVASTPLASSGAVMRLVVDSANQHYLADGVGGVYEKHSQGLRLLEFMATDAKHHEVRAGTSEILPKAYLKGHALECVVLPEGLERIGKGAFAECSNLQQVTIPDSVRTIGVDAFRHAGLTSIRLPAGLECLGEGALVTGAGCDATLRCATIEDDCARYYVENGFLCERREQEGDHAILYFGSMPDARVPKSVSSIGDFALARAEGIRTLVLHQGVRQVRPLAVVPGTHVRAIVVELPEPICGKSAATIRFPRPILGNNLYYDVFDSDGIDLARMYLQSDHAAYFARDTFERCSIMAERLACPICLSEKAENLFRETLGRTVREACAVFARHGYREGFARLVELGFLNEANIESVLAQLADIADAGLMAYLLELKRKSFSRSSVIDRFSL